MRSTTHSIVHLAGIVGLATASAAAMAAGESGGSAAALRTTFTALASRPDPSPFGIPMYLESTQTPTSLSGEIHSRIDHRFDSVRAALGNPRAWCEILILHPNVKACSVATGEARPSLTVLLGSMETLAKFSYQVVSSNDDYLAVRLAAETGPFGTSDYAIRVEAAPLDAERTLLHLKYSHDYGARAKLAMQAYFNTLGRNKVGFTMVDRTADGKPVYVGDLRGGLERNAVRYYLAIRAHLESLSVPPQQRLERGLRTWLAYIERYPLQLAENSGYAEVKRKDLIRLQSPS